MKNIKKENTKTKTSEKEKNNADNIIFDILQEYEQAKKQKKDMFSNIKKRKCHKNVRQNKLALCKVISTQ